MAFDSQAFIADLLKDVSVDDSVKQTLQTLTTNPQVAKRLEDGYLRQSEFSKLASQYQEKIKGAQEYWDGLAKWKQEEETRLEAERAAFKGAKPGSDGTEDKTKDFESKLQQLANESLSYMNTLSTLQMKHFKEFGEILDPTELNKSALKDKVSIDIAYDRLVQPKRDDLQKKDIERQLDAARKQGAEEALKNVKIPIQETPWQDATPHALDKFVPDNKQEYGALAAVKAFTAGRHKSA